MLGEPFQAQHQIPFRGVGNASRTELEKGARETAAPVPSPGSIAFRGCTHAFMRPLTGCLPAGEGVAGPSERVHTARSNALACLLRCACQAGVLSRDWLARAAGRSGLAGETIRLLNVCSAGPNLDLRQGGRWIVGTVFLTAVRPGGRKERGGETGRTHTCYSAQSLATAHRTLLQRQALSLWHSGRNTLRRPLLQRRHPCLDAQDLASTKRFFGRLVSTLARDTSPERKRRDQPLPSLALRACVAGHS